MQHTEFFEPRAAVTRPNALRLKFSAAQALASMVDFLTFPRPWQANTKIEFAFTGYMLYWYGVLFVLALGLSSWRRTWPLLILGVVLGTFLVLTTPGASTIVRWRLASFYLLLLSAGPALVAIPAPKRIFDVVVATGLLIVLSPVLLVVAVVLKLTAGSVFFVQERVGLGGQIFTLRKFVSMMPGSEGQSVAPGTDDLRITRLGRFLRATALDEAPELLSVLKGDMSIVGPRPLAVWDIPSPPVPGWELRQAVLPGIMGLAQLKTKRDDNEGKLKWDLEYIETHSFWADTRLLFVGLWMNVTRRWV